MEHRHPTVEEFAGFLSTCPEAAELFGRHLAAVCPDCGRQLERIGALLQRFGHWDPAIVVGEGLAADGLVDALLAAGQGFADWRREVEQRDELQTWGVAWVALERARALLSGDMSQARDIALLAAVIAGHLGSYYDVAWTSDLKALAYATAVAAEAPAPGGARRDSTQSRLQHVAAATEALEKGTGTESLAEEVRSLLVRGLT